MRHHWQLSVGDGRGIKPEHAGHGGRDKEDKSFAVDDQSCEAYRPQSMTPVAALVGKPPWIGTHFSASSGTAGDPHQGKFLPHTVESFPSLTAAWNNPSSSSSSKV